MGYVFGRRENGWMTMRWLMVLIFVLGFAGPGIAQTGRDADIQGIVTGQIDAFLRDDFEAAFGFASPNIRRLFGNSENFGTMVRQGYPMVWRPADVQFLELDDQGGRVLQNVMIRDRQGKYFVLEYEMIVAENGWQINGVRLLESPGVGA